MLCDILIIVVAGVSWIADMPIKLRYLFIAAYIAAKTNKEEDKYVFGDVKRGRRKRNREGRDESTADNSAVVPAGAMLHAPKSFSMERLLTIYNHIYSMHEDSSTDSMSQWRKYQDKSNNETLRGKGKINWQEISSTSAPRAARAGEKNKKMNVSGGEGFFAMVNFVLKKYFDSYVFPVTFVF